MIIDVFVVSEENYECGSRPSLLSSAVHCIMIQMLIQLLKLLPILAHTTIQKEEISLMITKSLKLEIFFICAAEKFFVCARKQCKFKLLAGMY